MVVRSTLSHTAAITRPLVRLAERGDLTLRVAQTYALEDAATAHTVLAKGGVRGRLVLLP